MYLGSWSLRKKSEIFLYGHFEDKNMSHEVEFVFVKLIEWT